MIRRRMAERRQIRWCQTMDTLVDKQSCLEFYPLSDMAANAGHANWHYLLKLLGACDELSDGILYRVQFVYQATSKDAVTVVEPTPNKCVDKCLSHISRQ